MIKVAVTGAAGRMGSGIIRKITEQDDMEVECAYDGEEALEKVKDSEFDLILLDIMLPKLTGLEVCQQIREFSDVPIVMLTAKSSNTSNSFAVRFTSFSLIYKRFPPQSSNSSPASTKRSFFVRLLFPAVLRMIALILALTSKILKGLVI